MAHRLSVALEPGYNELLDILKAKTGMSRRQIALAGIKIIGHMVNKGAQLVLPDTTILHVVDISRTEPSPTKSVIAQNAPDPPS